MTLIVRRAIRSAGRVQSRGSPASATSAAEWPASGTSRSSAPGMTRARWTEWDRSARASCSPYQTVVGHRTSAGAKPHGRACGDRVVDPAGGAMERAVLEHLDQHAPDGGLASQGGVGVVVRIRGAVEDRRGSLGVPAGPLEQAGAGSRRIGPALLDDGGLQRAGNVVGRRVPGDEGERRDAIPEDGAARERVLHARRPADDRARTRSPGRRAAAGRRRPSRAPCAPAAGRTRRSRVDPRR